MNNEQRGVVKPTTNQMTHMSHIEHQATSFGIELPSIDPWPNPFTTVRLTFVFKPFNQMILEANKNISTYFKAL